MKKLSEREERVLQIIWEIGEGFVKDVIAHFPDPKPPYNTVSSIVRILEQKGYVGHKAFGKTHMYFPTVSKEAYRKQSFNKVLDEYFEGSLRNVVSFMVEEESLDPAEAEIIRNLLKDLADKKGEKNDD